MQHFRIDHGEGDLGPVLRRIMWTRKSRLRKGASTSFTIAAATALRSASAGTMAANASWKLRHSRPSRDSNAIYAAIKSCKVPRIRCQDFVVGRDQDCNHKEKRDGQFGEKGGEIAVNARQGRGIANRFVRGCGLQYECCQRDTGNRAEKLP